MISDKNKTHFMVIVVFEDSGSSAMPTTDLDNTEQSELRVSREKINPKLGTPSAFSSLISHPQVSISYCSLYRQHEQLKR